MVKCITCLPRQNPKGCRGALPNSTLNLVPLDPLLSVCQASILIDCPCDIMAMTLNMYNQSIKAGDFKLYELAQLVENHISFCFKKMFISHWKELFAERGRDGEIFHPWAWIWVPAAPLLIQVIHLGNSRRWPTWETWEMFPAPGFSPAWHTLHVGSEPVGSRSQTLCFSFSLSLTLSLYNSAFQIKK